MHLQKQRLLRQYDTLTPIPELQGVIMSNKINLLGEVDNFFLALKDRLDRAGALFTSDSEEADIIVGLGKYAANESVDIAIIAENEDSRSGNFSEVKK